MFYTLNLNNVICQIYFNLKKVKTFIYSSNHSFREKKYSRASTESTKEVNVN